jgi:hypothetical protein
MRTRRLLLEGLSFATGSFAVCSSFSFSLVVRSGRRRSRYSCCGMSCTCCGARSAGRGCGLPIVPCWRRSARCCRRRDGGRSSSSRRHFSAGIAHSSAAAGRMRPTAGPAAAARADATADPAPGGGEPELGIQADPWRVGRARDPAGGEQRLERAPPPRHRARTETSGCELAGVPVPASVWGAQTRCVPLESVRLQRKSSLRTPQGAFRRAPRPSGRRAVAPPSPMSSLLPWHRKRQAR